MTYKKDIIENISDNKDNSTNADSQDFTYIEENINTNDKDNDNDKTDITGYMYESWHYRYVGVKNATDIATGKYNNGEYDSLEHYLKVRGMVSDLEAGTCE